MTEHIARTRGARGKGLRGKQARALKTSHSSKPPQGSHQPAERTHP